MSPEPASAAESVGQRLRRLRKERGLSQRELASPGVSYAYISRIEGGSRRPSVKALRRLAAKLGVSPEYLETGSDLDAAEERELRLGEAELALRLDDEKKSEATLADLLEESVRAGDLANANRARLALGFAAYDRGEYKVAARLFEEAIAAGLVSPVARHDVYRTLARAYAKGGALEHAVELLEDCLAAARDAEPYDAALDVRYATALSNALSDAGALVRAGEALTEALDRAGEAGDDLYLRVRLSWSSARLADMKGDSGTALHHMRRAMAMLESIDDTLYLGRAHLMCAAIFNSQDRAEVALGHLEDAEQLLGPRAVRDDIATLRVQRSRAQASRGDGESAVANARGAIEMLEGQSELELGSAYAALADGLALTEDHPAAEQAFRRAVEVFEEQARWREATQAAQAWAKMLRNAGREKEALDVLEHASELGLRLSQPAVL